MVWTKRRWLFSATALVAAFLAMQCAAQAAHRLPGELVWTIGYDPKTFDPAKVDDQESEMVRYLTAGVLLRFNRSTQVVEPQLAESWSTSFSNGWRGSVRSNREMELVMVFDV